MNKPLFLERLHRERDKFENLLNQDYQAVGGYPALPITIRTGVSVTLGGARTGP